MATVEVQASYWAEACAALRAVDPVMGALMDAHPTGMLVGRGAPLETLMRSVVGQQISVKAAQSIWLRFADAVGDVNDPAAVLRVPDEVMRGCGFSGSKVRYVKGIAQGFADGTVHPGLWDGMDDAAVIAELVKLPGIGRWTAEMFLMFHLLRPNVLPVDDLGLVKGYKLAYFGPDFEDLPLKAWQTKLVAAAEVWRPWRSVAVWYLWRSLDPVEVGY